MGIIYLMYLPIFKQINSNVGTYIYRFVLVAIGQAGRQSNGGILSNSLFGQALDSNLFIPEPSQLLNTTGPPLPYVMVANKVFPLKFNLLHPYPGQFLPGMLH